MELLIFLLLLSFPVFYVLGIVHVVQMIRGKRLWNGQQKLPEQAEEIAQKTEVDASIPVPRPPVQAVVSDDGLMHSWEHWYSDNSINLLLYIGAFLIVVSASIYVGFSWDQIDGVKKALILTALMLAFFGFGYLFYQRHAIARAGATFIGIGALLVPFVGSAWHNFVLSDMGISGSESLVMTSFVSLQIYGLLAYLVRHPFYTYITGVSGLVLSLALVSVSDLPNDYYMLAGVATSLVTLLIPKYLAMDDSERRRLYGRPLTLTAHIFLPLSLVMGLVIGVGDNVLFTPASAIAVFLAAVYYGVCYLYEKKNGYLVAALGIAPIALILILKWLNVSTLDTYSLSHGLIILYVVVPALRKSWHVTLRTLVAETGLSIAAVISVFALFGDLYGISGSHVLVVLPFLYGVLTLASFKKSGYIYYAYIYLVASFFAFFGQTASFPDRRAVEGLCLLWTGLSAYAFTVRYSNAKSHLRAFGISAVSTFLLSLLLTHSKSIYFVPTSAIVAGVLVDAAVRYNRLWLIKISNLLIYLTMVGVLDLGEIEHSMYPILLSFVAYVLYSVSIVVPERLSAYYRRSGLLAACLTTVIALFTGSSMPYSSGDAYRESALISAYINGVFFTLHAFYYKSERFGYFASFWAMGTYIWQMVQWEASEMQVYMMPVGTYFMLLALLQKVKKRPEAAVILEVIGLFILFMPLLVQCFGKNGGGYALLMGIEGVLLLSIGVSYALSRLRIAGAVFIAAAALSQSYQYFFSLPRWSITAGAGMIFLTTAVFLLIKRANRG